MNSISIKPQTAVPVNDLLISLAAQPQELISFQDALQAFAGLAGDVPGQPEGCGAATRADDADGCGVPAVNCRKDQKNKTEDMQDCTGIVLAQAAARQTGFKPDSKAEVKNTPGASMRIASAALEKAAAVIIRKDQAAAMPAFHTPDTGKAPVSAPAGEAAAPSPAEMSNMPASSAPDASDTATLTALAAENDIQGQDIKIDEPRLPRSQMVRNAEEAHAKNGGRGPAVPGAAGLANAQAKIERNQIRQASGTHLHHEEANPDTSLQPGKSADHSQSGKTAAAAANLSETAPVPAPVASVPAPARAEESQNLPVLRQTADSIETVWQSGRQMIRVRLKPDSFGEIQIHMNKDKEGMTARIKTDSTGTRDLLASGVGQLREILQEKGIDCRRIDIQYTGDPANSSYSAGAGSDTAQTRHQYGNSREPAFFERHETDAAPQNGQLAALAGHRRRSDGIIDVLA